MDRSRNILLTGAVGVGKTTVVTRVAAALGHRHLRGFYTAEIRDARGRRVGFRLVPLAGGAGHVLAHADLISPHRVGRYGVEVEMLDYVVDTTLSPPRGVSSPAADLYLIDEIGRMECFSARFVAAVERLLAAEVAVLATVALRGGGLIASVKQRDDVQLIEVTRGNRDRLPAEMIRFAEQKI
jgi:nucleoside-triphosphatase